MTKPFAGIDTGEQLEPVKLTPTERIYRALMLALQRSPQPPEHTVDISRNAKGAYQWAVAVRGDDLDEVTQRAIEKATELDARFPFEGEPDDPTKRAANARAAMAANAAASRAKAGS